MRILSDIKEKVLTKSGGKCALCHYDGALEIHHITPKPHEEKFIEDNLIVVCANCHRRIHLNKSKFSPEELKKYREEWYDAVRRNVEEIIDLDNISGYEFENIVSKLLANMGYKVVRQLISMDKEIDIIAYESSPILDQPIMILVECKYRKSKVNIADIRAFFGKNVEINSSHGVFISISGFTNNAREFATRNNITLIDREKLQNLLKVYFDKNKGEKGQ